MNEILIGCFVILIGCLFIRYWFRISSDYVWDEGRIDIDRDIDISEENFRKEYVCDFAIESYEFDFSVRRDGD